jgi:5'-nucleotidase
LLVSGINYGENVSTGVTVSGTVGAALEGASMGLPSLAISLETAQEHHLSYSNEVDFSAAAYFTRFFGQMLLEKRFPADVDVLKVDVPMNATPETPWEVTRLSRKRYFEPVPPSRPSWDIPALIGYRLSNEPDQDRVDTDSYALRVKKVVSVTPLSLDITSRVDLKEFERLLRSQSVE